MNTLIYHAGALGDFITTLPALMFWRKQNPDHTVIFLGRPENGILGYHAGIVDIVWDIDKAVFAQLYSNNRHENAKKLLADIEHAILFTSAHSSFAMNIRESGIVRIQCQSPFPESHIHKVLYHCQLFNVPPDVIHTMMELSVLKHVSVSFPHSLPDRYVCFHSGSGSIRKNWPLDRFYTVASWMREHTWNVIWIAGPAEHTTHFPQEDIVLKNYSLSQLTVVLKNAALYCGNDSGITHLAAAAGCPVVALFGPSDEKVWAPAGENVTIAIHRHRCEPCFGPKTSKQNQECQENCMNHISVEHVIESCRKIVGK